jgi:hypothetical protein
MRHAREFLRRGDCEDLADVSLVVDLGEDAGGQV